MDVMQSLGKYDIRGTLGRGAMGTVYDGWDPVIARRVAIKTVPLPADPDPETAEEIARFKREAQAAGRLTHPNIVGVYDYGETADMAYIVMEFVDGPSLKGLLDKQERFAVADVQRVMGDLLAGLQFSHERGVVHRDIKPANLMLTTDGRGKIADFGIARIEMSSMTQAGTMLGTPAYMSPEQFMGQVVDARTDVYSAGVLLYQLLTGERPFDGGLTAIMHKALHTDPPPPSTLAVTAPAALDAVVKRAMAKRPDDRYPSAAAFAEAIRAALSGAPAAADGEADGEATMVGRPAARPAATPSAPARPALPAVKPSAGKSGSKLPLLAGGAVAALLVAAAGGWFLLRPAPQARLAEAAPAAAVQPAPAEVQPAPAAAAPPAAPSPEPSAPPAPVIAAPAPAPTQTEAPAPVQSPAPAPAPQVQPPTPQVQPPVRQQVQPAPAPQVQPVVAPAPPPPPPVAAAPIQTASAGLGPLRTQLAQAMTQARCTLAEAVVQDSGRIGVSGYAGAGDAAALRQQTEGIAGAHPLDWRVTALDPVFCTALGTLRAAGGQTYGLSLGLAGGRTALHDGERIQPRLVLPDFPGEVRVDYLGHDGSVVHLYPTAADPAQKIGAQAARRMAAGEHLALGDPGPGKPIWEVGPPYGTDMIIAVAATAPLLLRAPAENAADDATGYLHDLAAAIAQARQAGTRVAATLLPVDTLAK